MSERETVVERPWAADRCPWVGKLRTVLPLTVGIRDSAVHLVLTHQRVRLGQVLLPRASLLEVNLSACEFQGPLPNPCWPFETPVEFAGTCRNPFRMLSTLLKRHFQVNLSAVRGAASRAVGRTQTSAESPKPPLTTPPSNNPFSHPSDNPFPR